jgi:pre-rRNA-processing protein TSR1
VEYSRIWEFESFGATARSFRQQFVDECWEQDEAGTGVGAHFCAIYLQDVPPSVLESQPRGTPFVLSATFPCEQKVTVVHGTVTRHREYTDPVKSKQELALHCGFRRFSARPIYSEIPKRASTCKKFKFSRFFHQDATVCASFYAPALFPPCRLLLFDHAASGGPELVASGAVTGADPKQLIIKRIILSGYPFRVHKSKAVVRFMFFRPEDIRWFKPVELTSKKGLRGHITESLGTHGYMKCRFNSHVKQDDTVCMMLYKRVYPKWHPPSWGGRAEDGPDTAPVTVTS